jgi:hypothetical protein
MSVRGQLDAMPETPSEILNEFRCGSAIARPHHPARHQLGIGIYRRPRPDASDPELPLFLNRDVLVLRPNERPDLIALNSAAVKIPKHAVLIPGADRASLNEQFRDGVFGNAGYADGGADAIFIYEAPNHLGASFRI